MDYRLGNNKKIKALGETTQLTCPKCCKKVAMSLFSNGELRLSADFPIISSGNVYFLVCPECSGIFGVDEAKGNTFVKGEKLAIGNYDLKELTAFEV